MTLLALLSFATISAEIAPIGIWELDFYEVCYFKIGR